MTPSISIHQKRQYQICRMSGIWRRCAGWICDLVVGGAGDICYESTVRFAEILSAKGLPRTLDIWDGAWHDWPWWRQMILKHI